MLASAALLASMLTLAAPTPPKALQAAASRATNALVVKDGEAERARIERGVAQAAAFWRPADGDATAFEAFCFAEFQPRGPALDATFARLESMFEQLDGHALEVNRELSRWAQLDLGPMQPTRSSPRTTRTRTWSRTSSPARSPS